MRRPIKKQAHQAFLLGEATFNTLSKEGLDESRAHFEKAVELEPDYARAMAELSYAYVHTATAGWHSDLEAIEALAKAEVYAKLAVRLDPDDYDTHWALGYYYINSGKAGDFQRGIKEFEKALILFNTATDQIDRKPGLLAEMGESLVYDGRPVDGIKLIEQAINLVPDWYRWNYAFALYCNKQYKEAIDSLDRMYRKPGDPRYLYDSLLTRAAAYAQLGKIRKAKDAVATFLKTKKAKRGMGWTIADELKRTPFKPTKAGQALRDHWIDGLRTAELPE
jgi:tetratricopeptide (TPR) repeat protein